MPLANATDYEHQYRVMPDECSLYVCCKLVCYDKINTILTRMSCKSFKDLWLLYTPPALTSKSYTFCPHSVWMCFGWISERVTMIFVPAMNCSFCVSEKECVYCAARNEFVNNLRSNRSLSPRRPGFDSRSLRVRFMVYKVASGKDSLSALLLFLCHYLFTKVSHSS